MTAITTLLENSPAHFPAYAPANAIFIWIPKNGGTSVFDALKRGADFSRFKRIKDLRKGFDQCGRVTFGHMDYRGLVKSGNVDIDYFDKAFKFGFVRDPYTRAVSLFLYLKKEGRVNSKISYLSFCKLLISGSIEMIGLYNSKGLSQCNPQVTWFRDIELDYLGRYEDLNSSFNDISNIFEISPEVSLRHLNSSNSITAYLELYCDYSRSIIENYYREDFETFGYKYWEG